MTNDPNGNSAEAPEPTPPSPKPLRRSQLRASVLWWLSKIRWPDVRPAARAISSFVTGIWVKLGRGDRTRPQASDSRQSPFRIVVVLILPIMMVTVGGWAVFDALNTDVIIRKFFIPAPLAGAVDPELMVQRAIDQLPQTVRDLSKNRALLRSMDDFVIGGGVPVTIGKETFCQEITDTGASFAARSALELAANRRINLQSSLGTAVMDNLGVPWRSFIEWLAVKFGKQYVLVDFNVSAEGNVFRLHATVQVTHADGANNAPSTYIGSGYASDGNALQGMVDEMILRVAYPEVAAIARAKRGAGHLDVERFLTDRLRSEKSEIFMQLAQAEMLLNDPRNAAKDLSRRVALMLLEDTLDSLAKTKNAAYRALKFPSNDSAVNQAELALSTLMLRAQLDEDQEFNHIPRQELLKAIKEVRDRGLTGASSSQRAKMLKDYDEAVTILTSPSSMYRVLAKKIIEDIAKDAGTRITEGWPNEGFDAVSNRWNSIAFLVELFAKPRQEMPGLMRHRYDALLGLAKRNQSGKLQDTAKEELFATALRNHVLLQLFVSDIFISSASVDSAMRQQVLNEVAFVDRLIDSDTPWIQQTFSAFRSSDEAVIEATGAIVELISGDFQSGIGRLKQTTLAPCDAVAFGHRLLDLAGRILQTRETLVGVSQPSMVEEAYSAALIQLRRAESGGVADLELYNAIGLAAKGLGDRELALRSFDRALQFVGDRSWIYLNRAFSLIELGRKPSTSTPGNFEFKRDDIETAEGLFRKAIDEERSWNTMLDHTRAIAVDNKVMLQRLRTASRGPCDGIYLSRRGLLQTLLIQDDAQEFARQYRRFSEHFTGGCGVSDASIEVAFGDYLIDSYCKGRLDDLPPLPTAAKNKYRGPLFCNLASYNYRGTAYRRKGQYDRAIQEYDYAISLSPNDALAYDNRGLAYEGKGEYDHATQSFDQAIKLSPNDAYAHNSACWTRAILNRELVRALDLCNRALRLLPNHANTLDSRGFVYFRMRQLVQARADYDAALAVNPKIAGSFFMRGVIKQLQGDNAGAESDFATAKAIDATVVTMYAKFGVMAAASP